MLDISRYRTVYEPIEALRESPAFRNYQHVLERVLALKELEAERRSGVYEPSDYWREELANFDYLLDASPLIINKLRHHCYHITGLRVYEYRSNRTDAETLFRQKLDALIALGGRDLLVPESPELGGFGFNIDGALYNIDTLKFYEVLIALKQGAILPDFQAAEQRKIVWEIGAGWGGFAYHFKKVCPNTTYVIVDFPELFLFSAIYLMTHFPKARVAFYDDQPIKQVMDTIDSYDFVFIPNTFMNTFKPPRLDLTINMVSFQEMTSNQVTAYVRHAHNLNCPYLYSLNRDRSPYNPELSSVSDIIRRFYWPHDITVLPVSYTKMLNKVPRVSKKTATKGEEDLDYKHIIGWRRVRE